MICVVGQRNLPCKANLKNRHIELIVHFQADSSVLQLLPTLHRAAKNHNISLSLLLHNDFQHFMGM